jgi:hypothetical protein
MDKRPPLKKGFFLLALKEHNSKVMGVDAIIKNPHTLNKLNFP